MVRLFTLIFLLATFTVHGQIGKTETEDYKASFEQKADIDEVSDYMLDYQLPIQVLNIGFTPELYEFYPELRENRVGLGVSNITLSYLEWTDRFLFTEDKEEIKQRMVKQHQAAAKGISANDIKVVGNVVLAEYFVYVEIYDYSVSEEEEVTVDGVKSVPEHRRIFRVSNCLSTALHEPGIRDLTLVSVGKLAYLIHTFNPHKFSMTERRPQNHHLVLWIAVNA